MYVIFKQHIAFHNSAEQQGEWCVYQCFTN